MTEERMRRGGGRDLDGHDEIILEGETAGMESVLCVGEKLGQRVPCL
jgi:hypothetical protein